MKTAIVVLLLLSLLPFIMAWVSGYYRHQQLGAIDNKNPRHQYTQLSGIGGRAVAAQQNAWEALAFYSAALLAVSLSNAYVEHLATAAWVVLVCRIVHAVCYLADLDKLRSFTFAVGTLPNFYLFYVAIASLS